MKYWINVDVVYPCGNKWMQEATDKAIAATDKAIAKELKGLTREGSGFCFSTSKRDLQFVGYVTPEKIKKIKAIIRKLRRRKGWDSYLLYGQW